MALAKKLLEEAAKRRKLLPVLERLIKVQDGGRVGVAALSRLLDLCGVRPTEVYMTQIMATKFGSSQGRYRPRHLKAFERQARVWEDVALREGGLASARTWVGREVMRQLNKEGLPENLPEKAGFMRMTETEANNGSNVRLPEDWVAKPNVPHGSTAERAQQFLFQAQVAPAYFERMEDYFWRECNWRDFPAWHKEFLWLHISEGMAQTEYAIRVRGAVSKDQAAAAIQLHRARAGLRPRR